MHMANRAIRTRKIASGIYGRHEDFASGLVEECYVIHNSKSVVVKPDIFASSDKDTIKQLIDETLEKLRT